MNLHLWAFRNPSDLVVAGGNSFSYTAAKKVNEQHRKSGQALLGHMASAHDGRFEAACFACRELKAKQVAS